MKRYTNISQLISEQAEDANFKIEGRPEDNLLNGLVQKRFAYSYTYPKKSADIITPNSILQYIMSSTEGDASRIKSVINGLSSPQAVGISADPSDKAGLFGGKNRVEGHVYLFKNITDSAVTSVNPDQLIGKTGANNVTAFQILSTPRTGGETIQQNLSKIMGAAGKTSSTTNTKPGATSTGDNLTMMELQVIMPQLGPGGKENGAKYYFTQVVNGTFRNNDSKTALIRDPYKSVIKTLAFNKGDKSIFIPASSAGNIEAGFAVRGPGISPNTTVTKRADPDGKQVELSISNPTYSAQAMPTIGFYDNYIFLESESPVMIVLSKFFSSQSPLNSIVSDQVNSYTPEIKAAFTEILNKSGDPTYKLGPSYNLDELTKTQLVSIMTAWLLYAVNTGVIPRSEIETDTYPTIKKYADALTSSAATAASGTAAAPSAMSQATNLSVKQQRLNRLAGKPTINNEEELIEILLGAGYLEGDILDSSGKLKPLFRTALVTAAGDSYTNSSAWRQSTSGGNDKLAFKTEEIGSFDKDTPKFFTPDYEGIHSAIGFLRLILTPGIPAFRKVAAFPNEPAINPVPSSAKLLAAGTRKDATGKKLLGPTAAEVAEVEAGFKWGQDLSDAVTFFRKKYYKIP